METPVCAMQKSMRSVISKRRVDWRFDRKKHLHIPNLSETGEARSWLLRVGSVFFYPRKVRAFWRGDIVGETARRNFYFRGHPSMALDMAISERDDAASLVHGRRGMEPPFRIP